MIATPLHAFRFQIDLNYSETQKYIDNIEFDTFLPAGEVDYWRSFGDNFGLRKSRDAFVLGARREHPPTLDVGLYPHPKGYSGE